MPNILEAKLQRQLALEDSGIEQGIQRYRKTLFRKEHSSRRSETVPAIRLIEQCMPRMIAAIDRLKNIRKSVGRGISARNLLVGVDSTHLAYLALRFVIDKFATAEVLTRVAVGLGHVIESHIEYTQLVSKYPKVVNYLNLHFARQRSGVGYRKAVISHKLLELDEPRLDWDDKTACVVGLKLLDLVVSETGLVKKSLVFNKAHSAYILDPTPEALNYLADANALFETLAPFRYPMIVQPLDWESTTGGGFLTYPTAKRARLIKSRIKEHHTCQQEMPEVLSAVNTLQHTSWRINKRILEVIKAVWDTSDGLGVLPDLRDPSVLLPPKPWSSDEEFQRMKADPVEKQVVLDWKRAAADIYDKFNRDRTKRLAAAQQISIAETLLDEEELFFVQYLDWRGRMYPVQQYITPQGNDAGVALLEFATGKPLGERGAYWLAVHTSNSFGFDKASFDERVQWVKDHESEIRDSVSDPIEGRRFWTEADSPFCFLAACYEWVGYLTEGESFVSHLPIQMDGSCNGLQHFSALLRDPVGGAAVNLVPGEKPSDVYAQVATVASSIVEADLGSEEIFCTYQTKDGDVPYTKGFLAQLWHGKIDRKVAKRNVMTTPYGVTKRGMMEQNLKLFDSHADVMQDGRDGRASTRYLTDVLFQAIGQVVVAARTVMDWIQEVSRVFNAEARSIQWKAPSGFTVAQKYVKCRDVKLDTVFGGARLQLTLREDTDTINPSKQTNGLSPNIIHSLDASHLVKTINECSRQGITHFSMVHDSFGTHAADIELMNAILREEFVKMYSTNLLMDLYQQFQAQTDTPLPLPPTCGSLDLNCVCSSPFFFC